MEPSCSYQEIYSRFSNEKMKGKTNVQLQYDLDLSPHQTAFFSQYGLGRFDGLRQKMQKECSLGSNITDASRRLKIKKYCVGPLMKLYGLRKSPNALRHQKTKHIARRVFVKSYTEGMTIPDLADKFKISYKSATWLKSKFGVEKHFRRIKYQDMDTCFLSKFELEVFNPWVDGKSFADIIEIVRVKYPDVDFKSVDNAVDRIKRKHKELTLKD